MSKKILSFYLIFILLTTGGFLFYIFKKDIPASKNKKLIENQSYLNKNTEIFLSQINTSKISVPKMDNIVAIHLAYGTYLNNSFLNILKAVENSKINAVVFEIKNPNGLVAISNKKHRNALEELLPRLRKQGIYTIARMVIFQDPVLVKERLNLAIKNLQTGSAWHDYKGIAWSDPTNREVWKYNLEIAKRARDMGFNEINFDYIRFPSDGPTKYAQYENLEEFETKENTITSFAAFTKEQLGKNVNFSINVFGMVFINKQLEIGQDIEHLAPYVDVIMPMPYPSHYPMGFIGFENPAEHPYEVIHYTLKKGFEKLSENSNVIVRPWLQDFNLGAIYGVSEINEQIRALSDFGIETWVLWNASNNYTWKAI